MIPRTNDLYPDSIDWHLFLLDNAVRLFTWKIELIKEVDIKNPVTAHSIPLGCHDSLGRSTYPVFEIVIRLIFMDTVVEETTRKAPKTGGNTGL